MSRELTIDGRRPRVLVTGIGGPAAQSFVNGFGVNEIDWVTTDADRLAPGYQLQSVDRRVVVPRGDDPKFVDALARVATHLAVDVIVPTVDAELEPIAASADRFAAAGISLMLAGRPTLDLALDKWVLAGHLRSVVSVPDTILVDDRVDLQSLSYPLIAKPRRGSGSRGVALANSREDLNGLPTDCTYIVQEYLPGSEYSVDVLARRDGSIACAVPRERMRVDSGIAITSRTVRDSRLIEFASRAARAIGLTGVANVQCKLDVAGNPALVEINPRFPGTMALTVAAGVNMPRLALGEVLGLEIPEGIAFCDAALVRTWQDHVIDPAALRDRDNLPAHAA